MKLDVLGADADKTWYERGLNFTCTQCGNCCTGPPGYVWISEIELSRLAAFLKLSESEVAQRYCRRVGERLSLKETRTSQGQYDCVFLREEPARQGAGPAATTKRCSIYGVRPLQCRTWPFWPENLNSPQHWERSARRCHGMGAGQRHFTREQIEAIRDAVDWPVDPPRSDNPG